MAVLTRTERFARQLAERNERNQADKRAAAALNRYLTPRQRAEWKQWHRLPGSAGLTYHQITVGKMHKFEIRKLYKLHQPISAKLWIDGDYRCLIVIPRLPGPWPLDDQVLTMKLAIEADELLVRRTAI